MKYYLLLLLLVIMGAGARTMFEIAHHALGREHDSAAPAADTTFLIVTAVWFMLMVVPTVILIRHKELKNRNLYIGLLSVGILVPAIYQFVTH